MNASAVSKQQIERLINENNPAAAKDMCLRLCSKSSDDPHAWFLMSAIHARLGEFADAERCCRKVINLAPRLPAVHCNRGIALQHLNRTEDAIESFRKAIQLHPDFPDAYIHLGDALRSARKPQQACNAYREAAKRRPNVPEIQRRLAAALRESGDLAAAELALQEAFRINPDYVPALLELGRIRILRKQYPEATAVFRAVLKVDATCKEAYEQLGGIELILGNVEAALEHHQKILEFMPTDIGTWALVIRMLASRGLLQRAEDMCRKGLSLNPDNVILLCDLGKILSEQEKMEEAVKSLKIAKSFDPENPEIDYLLSEFSENTEARKYTAKKAYVRKIFDGYADSFDTHLRNVLGYQIPELILHAAQEHGVMERKGLSVLDLGCGTGLCGPLFRKVAGRLIGVDLSPKMLEKARTRNVYDELYEADLTELLERAVNEYDLVLAADVFVYVGDLVPVFSGCAKALRKGGLFAFSVESIEGDNYALRPSGRYGHSMRYVQELTEKHGFNVDVVKEVVIRKDWQQPISGHIFVLKKELHKP